jgi:hypothetical protein
MSAFLQPTIVRNKIKKQARKNKSIIFGGQALNARMIGLLQNHNPNLDYDVFSHNPKRSARQLERNLDKKFGGDFYETKKGMFKGLWKVKRKSDGQVIADFVPRRTERLVRGRDFSRLRPDGVNYTTLGFETKKRKQILRDPQAKWRHDKARDDLVRIKANKRMIFKSNVPGGTPKKRGGCFR